MNARDRKGWLAVIGCSAAIFSSGALFFGYPGIMAKYWQTAFGVGADATGFVMTFALFGVGLMMFLAGTLQRFMGSQACLLTGTIFLAGGMLLLNLTDSIYFAYLWAFLMGTGNSFIYMPSLTVVQNWFPQCRGLVTGIVNLIFGTAAAIMSPVLNFLLGQFGYHTMNFILFLMITVVGLIVLPFVGMPTQARLHGEEWAAHQQLLQELKAHADAKGPTLAATSATPGQALRTLGFWAMWFTWCFMGSAGISMVSLATEYANSVGLTAVVVLTSFNLTNGLSRIVAGPISDLIGRNITGCGAFLLGAAGYFFLPYAHSLLAVSILAACVGFAFGTLFAISSPLTTDLFGLKHFGTIFGLIFTAYGLVGGLVGPALAGYVLTVTGGSFTVVFHYLAFFCLLSAGAVTLARRKGRSPFLRFVTALFR